MFKSKTLFIVGAGASEEATLPIGTKLAEEIAGQLNFRIRGGQLIGGNAEILAAAAKALHCVGDDTLAISAGRAVSNGMTLAPSIDTFLQTHRDKPDYILLGKLGIAEAILRAERNSLMGEKITRSGLFDLNRLKNTWYHSLAQQLFSGINANDYHTAFENVRFIVFNYDRCLEHFLMNAMSAFFQISPSLSKEIVESLDIIHPYGYLGSLYSSDEAIGFGADHCDLIQVASGLFTFSESLGDNDKSTKIQQLVRDAETIVFLGFGFLDQNMILLDDDSPKAEKNSSAKRVFATAHGLSDSDSAVVATQIGYLLRGRPKKERDDYSIDMFNGTCHELFREYWRSLTAAVDMRPSSTMMIVG